MSRREHQPRLCLIVTADVTDLRLQRSPKPKRRKPNPRTVLLRTLREQRQKIIGWPHFERIDAPELFDLAQAADGTPRGRKSFVFRGVSLIAVMEPPMIGVMEPV